MIHISRLKKRFKVGDEITLNIDGDVITGVIDELDDDILILLTNTGEVMLSSDSKISSVRKLNNQASPQNVPENTDSSLEPPVDGKAVVDSETIHATLLDEQEGDTASGIESNELDTDVAATTSANNDVPIEIPNTKVALSSNNTPNTEHMHFPPPADPEDDVYDGRVEYKQKGKIDLGSLYKTVHTPKRDLIVLKGQHQSLKEAQEAKAKEKAAITAVANTHTKGQSVSTSIKSFIEQEAQDDIKNEQNNKLIPTNGYIHTYWRDRNYGFIQDVSFNNLQFHFKDIIDNDLLSELKGHTKRM